jgi:uncharacterized membrane protein
MDCMVANCAVVLSPIFTKAAGILGLGSVAVSAMTVIGGFSADVQ